MTPDEIYTYLLEGVKTHPYLTICAIAVVEARINSICVGALAAQGLINPLIAYGIFVGMCCSGDTIYYTLARTGRQIGTCLPKTKRRLNWRWLDWLTEKVREESEKSLPWALGFAKTSGFGSKPVIVACGIAKMPLRTFYSIEIPCTMLMFTLYIATGYFFGTYVLRHIL